MKVTVRLTNLVLTADVEIDGLALPPVVEPVPPVVLPPATPILPIGFNADPAVALEMLLRTVRTHQLDAIDVQRHGQVIVNALNEDWPGLDAYVSASDAVVWPGFGSLDVTIDGGKGGWYFRPDGAVPWKPVGQR